MAGFWHDLRFGVRLLRRSPVLSAVAVLTFALGVGANSAVFSVVNAALLRPLPYPEPDRLVVAWETDAAQPDRRLPVAPADYLDWRSASDEVFVALTGYHPWSHTLTDRGEPTQLSAGVVDDGFFRALGVEPALGRTFRADEINAEGVLVVVLSDLLWRERFGADPAVLGAKVTLDDQPYTVVGVMPPGFDFPRDARLWRPIHLSPETARRDFQYLRVLGRLRADRSVEAGTQALATVTARLESAYPETNEGRGVVVLTLAEQIVGDQRPALLVLWGAVTLVLLVACANLGSLLLARAAARAGELAVRAALGAGRRRLALQFLGESLVLAALGGGLGLAIAVGGSRLLVGLSPEPIPGTEGGLLDGRVLLFTLALVVAAGLLFGLLPVLQPKRDGLASGLREAGRASGSRLPRLRGALVVAEIGLATVLTVGAGLLFQSFLRLRGVDPGFDPRGVLAVQVALPPTTYTEPQQTAGFIAELSRRVCALPGVSSCGVALSLPLANGMTVDNRFSIEGRAVEPGQEMTAFMRAVTPGYFPSLRIPVIAGRGLEERDDAASPGVVVINRALAERYWPGRDPVGDRVVIGAQLGGLGAVEEVPREVVGVIGDVKHSALDADSAPAIYFPMAQGTWRHLQVVARVAGDPLALAPALRAEVWEIDDRLPVTKVRELETVVTEAVAQPRFSMLLMAVFAAVAVLLAAVGVYGVISYTVHQRYREVGVRLALGAGRGDVQRLVLAQGARLAAAGLALGLLLAVGLSRLLRSLLYGVDSGDPLTFLTVLVVLAAVALAASYLPARRAARIDPVVTLRAH